MRDLLGLLPDGSLKQDIEAVMNKREVPDVPPPQDEAAYPSLSTGEPTTRAKTEGEAADRGRMWDCPAGVTIPSLRVVYSKLSC